MDKSIPLVGSPNCVGDLDLPREELDDYIWQEITFSCLCPSDPVELLRGLVTPKTRSLMPPGLHPYGRNMNAPDVFVVNTEYAGISLSISIAAPGNWTFMKHRDAPSIPFDAELEADERVWFVKLHVDWRLFYEKEDWPNFAGPLDILAALMETDSAIFMENSSDYLGLFRPGFLRQRLSLPHDAAVLVQASIENGVIVSPRWMFDPDPRIPPVTEIDNIEMYRAISVPWDYGSGKMNPELLADLDARMRELFALRKDKREIHS